MRQYDVEQNPRPPSKCCALNCGKICAVKYGVELPFCEECNKDEKLWQAWNEIT